MDDTGDHHCAGWWYSLTYYYLVLGATWMSQAATLKLMSTRSSARFGRATRRREAGLEEEGIGSMVYYPVPCHRLPVYSHLDLRLPSAELAASEVLSLPIWPTMPEEVQGRVASVVRRVLTV